MLLMDDDKFKYKIMFILIASLGMFVIIILK